MADLGAEKKRRVGISLPNGSDYVESSEKVDTSAKKNKKRKNHSQLGKNFVAPDGGFGWFIVIAAGVSNVSDSFVLTSGISLHSYDF